MNYLKKHPFIITIFLLSSVLFLILYIHIVGKYNNLQLEYKVNLKGNTEIKYQILKKELSEIQHDIYFIGDLYKQQNNQMFVNKIDNLINLELVIESFSLRHSFYSQIRFLDLKGKEFLRINNAKGNVSIVSSDKLQDKSNRYYYKNAIHLQDKEIYLSAFDLNIEHGQVEKPHNPTLRIVMPIYKNNTKSGYIIINYKGKNLLEKLRSMDVNGIQTYIVNNEGFYFIADEKIKEWSFMFDKKYTIEKDHARLWSSIKEGDTNIFVNESTIYTFKNIKPIDLFNNKVTSNKKWTIISYIDKETIYNDFQEYLYSILYIVLFFMLLVVLFSYIISLYIKKISEYEEESERSKNKLIEANKLASLGQMIDNIAHQWRQPLATISMTANNLGVNIALDEKITNKELESSIDQITEQTQYLSKTIDEISHFVKISNEKPQKVNIKSIVNNSITFLNDDFKSNHIDIHSTINDNYMFLKENEFTHILLNILNNSIDAMSSNTKEVERHLFINSTIECEFFVLKIRDSGGGIKENIMDKIFEPYFTTKHKAQGTGLSLYMAYQIIVHGYDGRIEVENIKFENDNKEYQGIEFSIFLPLSYREI